MQKLNIRKHFDVGSILVISVTFILFVAAVFTRGWTHDLLLEAAVFLVSVKLVIMAYKNIDATDSVNEKLNEISDKLNKLEDRQSKTDSDDKQ